MKFKIGPNHVTFYREDGEKAIGKETEFFHKAKVLLNRFGFEFIKKLMYKDGHMVSDYEYYIRSRLPNPKRDKTHNRGIFCLHDTMFNIRQIHTEFNKQREVTLAIEYHDNNRRLFNFETFEFSDASGENPIIYSFELYAIPETATDRTMEYIVRKIIPPKNTWSKAKMITLFSGKDFRHGAIRNPFDGPAIADLIFFHTVKPGDVDSEYYADWSPAQLEFADEHGDEIRMELENRYGPEVLA